jgi:nitric oxide reductase subunit B
MDAQTLKRWSIISFVVAMAVLLIGGYFAMDAVPPYPDRIVCGGKEVSTKERILQGQNTYQRYGLMDHGSIWGHGTLRGMDFSATSLHMMAEFMREYHARELFQRSFASLAPEDQSVIKEKVIAEIKTNRYDAATRTLQLTPAQGYAFQELTAHWEKLFSKGDARNGFLPETIKEAGDRTAIGHFFFWTAWAAGTLRPGLSYTYTNNWPHDPTAGNGPSPHALLWSILSILGLLVVLGIIVYVVHRYRFFYGEPKGVAATEKLLELPLSTSQVKAAKYFIIAGLLFVLQILNGGLLAHYTVHPGSFYIPFIAKLIPYSVAKSWHLQLGIFWIAVSWVGTAIFLAPVIGGKEPRGQGLLVDLLFGAVLVVALGSLGGEYLGIKGSLGSLWFWLGHQGWEFLELGKAWQALLFVGLLFWLVIVYRALAPKLAGAQKDASGLTQFYTLSAIAVVGFFAFGLFYGRGTHLTIADYWRWFVVHIWVESIFEFFGVAVIALFLVTLGLVDVNSAMRVSYLTAILVFVTGIIGTSHHYYWYGGPSFWLALGGVFSSLEPIPLILLVVRAWMEYASIQKAGAQFPYRWPLLFLTASSFWNFLGAGVFGFIINLPIVNYYEHATYLTTNHGHTALFGVYGMLAVALLLFSWRSLVEKRYWNDAILRLSFWGMNGGLFLMFLTVLLPVGCYQVWKVFTEGLWYARSAAFYNLPLVQSLGAWRIVPDTIIILFGALPLLYFLITTYTKLRTAR